ncbi:hypothetical protein KY290_022364 [Solanum tuberosum]|uniref:Retrotransposon gag domain-containing protein n=1 Tax=Solanum tuberosum TaxID=4113 RepID=A0ABQ7V610_SOLTU|nr:hypothetical protein KY289_021483 [Solanum tuberosum]KAH0758871.1 hypothetical protein KY290_022364 [Solanum tuberosum]
MVNTAINDAADQVNSTAANGVPPMIQGLQAPVDFNHPLYLSNSDVSGRNKVGLVDRSWNKERFPVELWGQWERVNAIVLSWQMNSVSSSLLGGVVYATTAQGVWQDLKERFDKIDRSRTFNIHQEIATMSQGVHSVSVYFTKLNELWDEFESMVPFPACNYERSKDFIMYLQRQKLYQFLMGLNDTYSQARSQILVKVPLPSVNAAYSMVMSDESQKSIAQAVNALGLLGAMPGNSDIAMYSKLVGYPPGHPRHGEVKGGVENKLYNSYDNRYKPRRASAHNAAISEESDTLDSTGQHMPPRFTSEPMFTSEQYEQICRMLEQ